MKKLGPEIALFMGIYFSGAMMGSLQGALKAPPFMIWGSVVVHVVSSLCASAYDAESLRIQTSRSF